MIIEITALRQRNEKKRIQQFTDLFDKFGQVCR